jgi:hypothetical protein
MLLLLLLLLMMMMMMMMMAGVPRSEVVAQSVLQRGDKLSRTQPSPLHSAVTLFLRQPHHICHTIPDSHHSPLGVTKCV